MDHSLSDDNRHRRSLRLECIRLAAADHTDADTDFIVGRARSFAAFVLDAAASDPRHDTS